MQIHVLKDCVELDIEIVKFINLKINFLIYYQNYLNGAAGGT